MAIRRFSTSSLTTGSKSSKFWDQETRPGAFESIAVATADASSSTITFSNIPQNYTQLQLRINGGISFSSNAYDAVAIQFNGDTTASNYNNHLVAANGSTPYSVNYTTQRNSVAWLIQSNTGILSNSIIDILDYTNTSKNTVCRSLSGFEWNTGGGVFFNSTLWINTAAVTSLALVSPSGAFINYSTFALYGIRGA